MELIKSCNESIESPSVLTGTPGTGKSLFRNSVLSELLKCNGYREILFFGSEGYIYVFKVNNNKTIAYELKASDLGSYDKQLRLNKIEYFILYDATAGKRDRIGEIDKRRTIIFSSPNEEILSSFDRNDPRHFLMPFWSKKEIDDMCIVLKIKPSEFTTKNLEMYGYIPRLAIYKEVQFLEYIKEVEKALLSIANCRWDRGKFVHRCCFLYNSMVGDKIDFSYSKCQMVFGTEYMRKYVEDQIKIDKHEWYNGLLTSGMPSHLLVDFLKPNQFKDFLKDVQ